MLDRQEAILALLLGAVWTVVYGFLAAEMHLYYFGGGVVAGMAVYSVVNHYRPKERPEAQRM